MSLHGKVFRPFIILSFILLAASFSTQALAEDPVGKIVSKYGDVWVSSGPTNPWRKITGAEDLYIGYTVKTGRLSGASLRMEDESLIRLSQQSEFVVEGVRISSFWRRATSLVSGISQGVQSTYRLLSGKLWGRNNNRNLRSRIVTTTATIGIRGTEYTVEASKDSSRVSILEGVVLAENEQGSTSIRSGEAAVIQAGQAPRKSTIVQLGESVQWTVLVPDLVSFSQMVKRNVDDKRISARVYEAYQQTRYATALDLLSQQINRNPQNKDLLLVHAWINIKAGESGAAYQQLKALAKSSADNLAVQEMTAFSAFLNGDLKHARTILDGLKKNDSLTDTGWVVDGYLHQADYDLKSARQSFDKALQLNTDNQVARVQLATIYFGSDQPRRALTLVNKSLAMQPGYVPATNLKGFIQLSLNESALAITGWESSRNNGQANADTHFGLSLAYMRKGRVEEAMQSIATAVLLDPQRSMYLSYWGKMLHQIGRYDKALTVLDSAIRLDQQDPTPRLYKAIILRDLNKPGEAIENIQAATTLNDNRGVYRSRSLLDKDLAVQNVDLSRLFTQLGLADWAHKKAMDSIKSDFTNASGHILNAGAYAEMENRTYALGNEALLARMLQPANINAFSSFNGYTSLFEEPGREFDLQLGAGNHGQQEARLIGAGAYPGSNVAWALAAVHDSSDGWRDTNGESFDNLSVITKWQPSENNNFLLTFSAFEIEQLDDLFPRYEIDSVTDDYAVYNLSSLQLEFGLHHRVSHNHDILAYVSLLDVDGELSDHVVDQEIVVGTDVLTQERLNDSDFKRPHSLIQLQGQMKLRNHQLFYGLLASSGENRAYSQFDYGLFDPAHNLIDALPTFDEQPEYALDIKFSGLYLQDSWLVNPSLQLDLAVYVEQMDNANALTGGEWSLDETTARFGLVWKPIPAHTFRLASFEYLLPFIASRLDPTDIAGVPIYKNTNEGSLVKETDLVWDFEWNRGLISATIFKVEDSFTSAVPIGSEQVESTTKSTQEGIIVTINQLLTPMTGVKADLSKFDVEDEAFPKADRNETDLSLVITHIFNNNLSISAQQIMRDMEFENGRNEDTINITNLRLNYEFSDKRQQLTVEVVNLLDEEFNWVTDQFSTTGIAPERMIRAGYRLSF